LYSEYFVVKEVGERKHTFLSILFIVFAGSCLGVHLPEGKRNFQFFLLYSIVLRGKSFELRGATLSILFIVFS